MVSALYAIMIFRRWWQIVLIVASAFPLAMFGNYCRILMLTFGTIVFGSDLAIGSEQNPTWFHAGAVFLVYIAALGGVLFVGWSVSKLSPAGSVNRKVPDHVRVSPPVFPLGRSLVVLAATGLAAGLIYLGRDMNQDREGG
jgi:exosortase/archaeosortase family protein